MFIKNLALFVRHNVNDDDAVVIMERAIELEKDKVVVELVGRWADGFRSNEDDAIESLVKIGSDPDDEWWKANYNYCINHDNDVLEGFADATSAVISSIVFPTD